MAATKSSSPTLGARYLRRHQMDPGEPRSDVIALAVDVGQERQDLEFSASEALQIGAVESIVKDVREEYVEEFLAKALRSQRTVREQVPASLAMSRPIIVKHLVVEAHSIKRSSSRTGAPARATIRFASSGRDLAGPGS